MMKRPIISLSTVLGKPFARFLLVGVLNTLIGLSSSFLLYNLVQMGYWAATFGGNLIGAIASYFLNRRFTFRSNVSVSSSWWKFAVVIISCYAVSYGCSLWISQSLYWLLPQASQKLVQNFAILLGNGLYTILNYLGHKYFTFRTKPEETVLPSINN